MVSARRSFSYNNGGEVAVDPKKPNLPDPAGEERRELPENPEEFFQRMPGSFHWPKPTAEAIAAAVEAIQQMSSGTSGEDGALAIDTTEAGGTCAGCGVALAAGVRFCGECGFPTRGASSDAAGRTHAGAGGQHHYHHHYHHFISGPAAESGVPAPAAAAAAPRGRASASAPGGRAEAAARQVAQDWAQACNTRHLDDLLELYSSDATVIRSNLLPVRSLPAIREFLFSLLEAGLGDVEMESLRTEVMGDVALDLGRCKMLVPVAMGKRREERGKYFVLLVRQPAGTWKILIDSWSSDLVVSAPASPEAARKGNEPAVPPRKAR